MTQQIDRIINELRVECQLADARLRLDGMLIQGELGHEVNELDWASTIAEISQLEREQSGTPLPEQTISDALDYELMTDSLRRGEG